LSKPTKADVFKFMAGYLTNEAWGASIAANPEGVRFSREKRTFQFQICWRVTYARFKVACLSSILRAGHRRPKVP
jgi:hypothetical protein